MQTFQNISHVARFCMLQFPFYIKFVSACHSSLMAYLNKVLCKTVPNSHEFSSFFSKKEILNPSGASHGLSAHGLSAGRSRPIAAPCRPLGSIHISSVVAFMSNIKYKYYIEKNYVHKDVSAEVFNHANCVGLGEKDGVRKKPHTKVFVFTFVCRGTSLCRATATVSPTSKRRFCGYGTRLFAVNSAPDIVQMEEFGRHVDSAGEQDLGYKLVPPSSEIRPFTIEQELEVLRSIMRGLTPAKHVTYVAEQESLSRFEGGREAHNSMVEVSKSFRRFRRMSHTSRDIDGVKNILKYLSGRSDFYISVHNLEEQDDINPLIILIMSRQICESIQTYGKAVLGLDATFNVCVYGFALFAVMGRTPAGALPYAYIISSAKSELAVSMALLEFRRGVDLILFERDERTYGADYVLENFSSFCPNAFCIDKDASEAAAISAVFPSSLIILCHYHFMVIMIDELRASRHSLSETEITHLMNMIRQLASATSMESFLSYVGDIKSLSQSFYDYFEKNFLNERWIDTFSEVNRQHLPISVQRLCRSNMLCEVSFRTLKYVIFGGLQNRRLDDLIYSLVHRVFPYFQCKQGDATVYRPRYAVTASEKIEGSILYTSGHVSQVSELHHIVLSGCGENTYTVISQREGETVEHKCTCLRFAYHKNICKHIYAVRVRLGYCKVASEDDEEKIEVCVQLVENNSLIGDATLHMFLLALTHSNYNRRQPCEELQKDIVL